MVDLGLMLNWLAVTILICVATIAVMSTASGAIALISWALRLGSLLWVPTPTGVRPIDRRAVTAAGTGLVDRAEQVAAIRASQPPAPHILHQHAHAASGRQAAATERQSGDRSEPRQLTGPRSLPTFADLLDRREIGPDQPLVFGVADDGQLIRGSINRLYSAGLGGLQGSGKTWTAAFLACLICIMGGRLMVLDPHGTENAEDADPESLTARIAALAPAFLAPVATTPADMLRLIDLATSIMLERKAGDRDRTPVVVIIDEWTALMRDDELRARLMAFMAMTAQEGRKFSVVGLLLSQRWSGEAVGGNDIRNALTSAYVHRMRPEEARMLTGLRAAQVPPDTLQLAPGTAYLMDTSGTLTHVTIPQMTPQDIERVGAMVATGETNLPQVVSRSFRSHDQGERETGGLPEVSHLSRFRIVGETPPTVNSGERENAKQSREDRARELLEAGTSMVETIRQVWHVMPGRSRAYNDARAICLRLRQEIDEEAEA